MATVSVSFLSDVQTIIETSKNRAYAAINIAMLERNWLLGKRIAEEEINGKKRADYGVKIIAELSRQLTGIYGKGFTKTNLYSFLQFYKMFPEIFHTPCGKSAQPLLTWSHYRSLLRVLDSKAREWYMQEAVNETWSARTLDRNISTQYYYRLLASQNKAPVKREMRTKTKTY